MLQLRNAFTFVELLVVMVIVTLAMVLLMAMLSRRHPRPHNSSQLRGIHCGLVLYSQDNNTYYPGFSKSGKPIDSSVEGRFKILIDNNYFVSEYIISGFESKFAWQKEKGELTSDNMSFALLNLSDAKSPRIKEWRDTSNSEAVIISDRAIANGDHGAIRSIHTKPRPGYSEWRGEVAYNDNHVVFEAAHDKLTTQYSDSEFVNDNLFDTKGASMVYKGVDALIDPGK
jgi:prepilin-type N-terminal cleavage/methylation domain-containing protein